MPFFERFEYFSDADLLHLRNVDKDLRTPADNLLRKRFIAYVLQQWTIHNKTLQQIVEKDIIDKKHLSVGWWNDGQLFKGFVALGKTIWRKRYAALVTNSKTLYTITNLDDTPLKKPGLEEKRVVSVDVGSDWAFAVTSDGKMWLWSHISPLKEVTQMRGKHVKQVAAYPKLGGYPTYYVALIDDGTLWTGHGDEVDLDNFERTPMQVTTPADEKVVQVASGGFEIVAALTEAGAVCTWRDASWREPTKVVLPDSALQVAVGRDHIVTRTNTGDVYVWGAGSDGQLGLGYSTMRHVQVPTKVNIANQHVVQVAAGHYHTVLLTSTGKVLMCGDNQYQQLGAQGLSRSTFQPIPSNPTEFFVCVAANNNSTMLVTSRGKVYCYGEAPRLNIKSFNAITGSVEDAAGNSGADGGGARLCAPLRL
tara:strand:- start:1431 stop:2696 length:1266 start_codon:yes stop_codon:yes gene_type:complete